METLLGSFTSLPYKASQRSYNPSKHKLMKTTSADFFILKEIVFNSLSNHIKHSE
jgi:hypothetical protein